MAALWLVSLGVVPLVGLIALAAAGSLEIAAQWAAVLGLPVAAMTGLVAYWQLHHDPRVTPSPSAGSATAPTQAASPSPVAPAPREPDDWPIISDRVPVPPRLFVGRDELLARLSVSLHDGTTRVLTQAIGGMGGVGKTMLAAALAEAHREAFDLVWWVRAERPDVLVADMAELATRVGMGTVMVDGSAEAAHAARAWLERTERRWLVVFDNATDVPSVAPWLPVRGRGRVVVTSRNQDAARLGDRIQVETFPDEVAARFLRQRVQNRNPAAAQSADVVEVVRRLGGLPLALEQAAAWVERVPNRTFSRYAELFDDAAAEPFPEDTRPIGYEHTASTAWRVSIAAATAEAPLAGRIMAALGFFAPDSLPCAWLRDMADDEFLRKRRRKATPRAVDDALDALHVYSLVRVDSDDTVNVHRVVQAAARGDAPTGAAAFAVRVLHRVGPVYSKDRRRWPTFAALAPHALTAADTAQRALPAEARRLCELLNVVAFYQERSGAPRDAIDTASKALELATRHLGPADSETLTSGRHLAGAYASAGNTKRAIAIHKANLADAERALGPDHPETLAIRSDLAFAHGEAHEPRQAIALLEAILPIKERVLGPHHDNTFTTRSNLANQYRAAGEHERAITLQEANLTVALQVLGPDRVETLTSRNNLAVTCEELGDFERSIELHETNLAEHLRTYGRDDIQTLATRNNLAHAYESAGQLDLAIVHHEENVADTERILGPDHPQTLVGRNNLARAYEKTGDLERALPLYETTLAARERVLGPDHPYTIISRDNLARARRNQHTETGSCCSEHGPC